MHCPTFIEFLTGKEKSNKKFEFKEMKKKKKERKTAHTVILIVAYYEFNLIRSSKKIYHRNNKNLYLYECKRGILFVYENVDL